MLVGLGGGALASFLRRSFRTLTLEAAELDVKVLHLARAHFGLQTE